MASESRKMTVTIGLRLTPDEYKVVREVAETAGIGTSTLAREAVLVRAKLPRSPQRKKRDGLQAEVGNWVGEANRIGSNLSQLAKHANDGGRVDALALEALQAKIQELHKAVRAATGVSV